MLVIPLIAQLLATAHSTSSTARDTALSHSTIMPTYADGSRPGVSFRYGKISGRVVDTNQKPIAGALVSIDLIAGGRMRAAWVTTDSNGRFVRDSLLPGMRYLIEVNRVGYQAARSEAIVIASDTVRAVELVLRVVRPNVAGVRLLHR